MGVSVSGLKNDSKNKGQAQELCVSLRACDVQRRHPDDRLANAEQSDEGLDDLTLTVNLRALCAFFCAFFP